ncbi:hypothetical protein, unlikely [Trypanosoma brucei gambiense DAL972]|uniref:Uncharacterized protein n=1 Tax=Trypanosoma brucei gambiense (strain MHOM/CI/86/DAL972) TaxID=679716 RepID=D0A4M9_TRYB9|nr:hypothetical protein, unlikely [Trypanosoma brucei gambiense DAL972]CBH16223.1 hypothetical protein, unlikely [Trypanosoma brucei gambiense DAL972]|eukprot:XP_011778487.1 hypothetical protein, unlikely [Trypanosoma brucei gambiense DAL972]
MLPHQVIRGSLEDVGVIERKFMPVFRTLKSSSLLKNGSIYRTENTFPPIIGLMPQSASHKRRIKGSALRSCHSRGTEFYVSTAVGELCCHTLNPPPLYR